MRTFLLRSMLKWTALVICSLWALQGQADLNQQYQILDDIQKNPEQLKDAAIKGKDRAGLCGRCHGEDGNSKRNFIPNLADQNAKYLVNQFEQFANGSRKNYVMSQLASTLTLEDRVNLAIYFSSQQAKPFVARKPKVIIQNEIELGRADFQDKCQMCHGEHAEGWAQLPRLASQPSEYLAKTLKKFKTGHRDRSKTPMTAIAKQLSDDQIKNISVYLSTLE